MRKQTLSGPSGNNVRLLLFTFFAVPAVAYRYQDYFPPEQEEYDPFQFDPHSLFGSPLGGYARATRSRLAALPMRFVGDSVFWGKKEQHVGSKMNGVKEQGHDDHHDEQHHDLHGRKGEEGQPYFTFTDVMGREFACSIYDEDDLAPESIAQSVFDMAIERKMSFSEENHEDVMMHMVMNHDDVNENEVDGPSFSQNPVEDVKHEKEALDSKRSHLQSDHGVGTGTSDTMPAATDDSKVDQQQTEFVFTTSIEEYVDAQGIKDGRTESSLASPDILSSTDKKAIIESLSNLDGVCAQLHLGWWSYEWCYNDKVTQFHVQVQANQMENVLSVQDLMPEFVVQSVSTIGVFKGRKIIVEVLQDTPSLDENQKSAKIDYYDDDDLEDDKMDDIDNDETTGLLHPQKDPTMSDILVVESHENGDYCEEVDRNRSVQVQMQCCSNEDIVAVFRSAGVALQNPEFFSKSFESTDKPKAVLMNVEEKSVCDYTMTVCTNVLCDSWLEETAKNIAMDDADADGDSTQMVVEIRSDESIREILDKTLANSCLRRNEGWWSYSFCYKSSIYQYHESVDLNREQGVVKAIIEASHLLGKYDAKTSEGFSKEEEIHHVVFPKGHPQDESINKAYTDSASSSKTTQSFAVTDSPYYVQEYTHGDVCEGEDVIDSAIKGGEVGEGGIERSTTVRFFCGNSKELLKINEDHTCHYVVDITLPELCSHKYFAVPQIKKHVMKCVLL